MQLRKRWLRALLFLVIVIVVLIFQYFEFFSANDLRTPTEVCSWKPGDPQLFYMRTTSGVNYDGGHWFHVAENFMVQHAILRNSGGLANSSVVIFNTDRATFDAEMNGVTRLMLALGMTSGTNKNWLIGSTHINFPEITPGTTVVLHEGDFIRPPSMYSSDTPEAVKFMVKSPKPWRHHGKLCVRYMGSTGGEWPTPQRGHWFPRPGDVQTFRSKIDSICPYKDRSQVPAKNKKYKMVIYQRDLSRVIVNLNASVEKIKSSLPNIDNWEVQILMHSQSRSPCALAAALHDTDVLVTAHGFQSMLLLFLPLPSLLFEIYPYRYYKPAYGPLSREYGIIHSCVMSPPQSWINGFVLKGVPTSTCMATKTCREFARGDDVELTDRGIMKLQEGVKSLLEVREGGIGNDKKPAVTSMLLQ